MGKVVKTKHEGDIKETIRECIGGLGGCGFEMCIDSGDVVLVKPNFNTADDPPARTSIDFLKAVVELAYEAGAKLVMIGESSTMSQNSRKVMERSGVFKLQEMNKPPRIYVFDEGKWVKKNIPNAKYLKSVHVPSLLDKADKLILLPCLKTHSYAQYTGALKLSVGFMKPLERVSLHARHLQEKIAELNLVIKPDLLIMDGRKCFINGGPSEGEVKEPGLVLASTDRVAIDIEGIKIIQGYKGNSLSDIDALEMPQIKLSKELGI